MDQLVKHKSCPACKSISTQEVFRVKDFSVSGELFTIFECLQCSFRFTQNVPCQTAIGRYYQSSAYVSHSDTKKGIINKLYHLARTYTLKQKLEFVREATGKAVGMSLDVGSGTGAFVHTMEKAGWSSIGLEPDADARALSVKIYNADVYPAEDLFALPQSTYNAITMWHVLEHVHELDAYILQLKKLLAPGGKLIIAVPNYKSKDARHYGAGWAAYDVPRHLYHFSPKSMRALMERHQLSVIKTQPMWLDSFYVSMLSEKYKGGNLVKAFFAGLKSNINTIFNREECSSLIYVVEAKL